MSVIIRNGVALGVVVVLAWAFAVAVEKLMHGAGMLFLLAASIIAAIAANRNAFSATHSAGALVAIRAILIVVSSAVFAIAGFMTTVQI